MAIMHPGPASAHWAGAQLGASFAQVRAEYPEAREIKGDVGGPHALELPPLTYSGVRWERATLAFDSSGQLDHVTFETRGLDFDLVKARVDDQWRRQTTAQAPGPVLSRLDAFASLQMRICQDADGRIDVTFEAPKFDS